MPSFVQLVAGLSHQLNNPLAAILGYSELVLRRNLEVETRSMIEQIHRQAERCKQVLHSLSGLVRRPAQGFYQVDINHLVRETLVLKAAELAANGIEVLSHLHEGPLAVTADALGLQQVLLELLENARAALENKAGKRTVSVSTALSGGRVVIEVEDDGIGITEDVLGRVFEPFFTTDKEKKAGLGLTLCYSILQEHGGTIDLLSKAGKGTRVRLHLHPLVEPARTEAQTAPIANLSGKRVLVVEDEPALAQLLTSLLMPLKAMVVQAADGTEALTLIRSGNFDLVLSDVQMPGMSGTDLYRQLSSENPALASRMILITGDSASGRTERLLQGVKARFLYKPFSRAQLLEAVSLALAGHKSD